MKKNNYTLKHESFSEQEIPRICELYRMGVSAKTLGQKFSIDKRRVQEWASEEGILRNKNDSHRITHFDQHYFDEINSPIKAYWLGFLYADAYNSEKVNSFTLILKREDKDHIVKLARVLNYPEEKVFEDDVELKGKIYLTAGIKLHSKHLCYQMNKLGCSQGKSFIITFPDWLDKKLYPAFILGLFDGDGSIDIHKNNEWRWRLAGTQEILLKIQQIIHELKINCYIKCISETENNTYELTVSGNMQIYSLTSWLYDNCPEYLERKYQRFLRLETQQKNKRSN